MKSQKGITIMSLLLYIISFTIIVGIVGNITVFFNKNLDTNEVNPMIVGTASEYNKFNLYMLKLTKSDYQINKIDNSYITFENNLKKVTLVKIGNILYCNKIKLCENITDFTVQQQSTNGKTVLSTKITIGEEQYSTDYVLE